MFPAEGRQVGQITGCRMVALLTQVIDGALQVGCIPQNDGCDEQVQPAGAMELVLIGAVADFSEPVEEYGAAERILLLTLVEADVAAMPQFGVLQPLEGKECPF